MNTVEPSSNLPHSHASPTRCPSRSAFGVRLVATMVFIIPATRGSPRTRYMSVQVWFLSSTIGFSDFCLATLCFLLAKCLMAVRGPSVLENFNSCKHSSQVLSPLGAVESFSLVSFTALYMATCRAKACCSAVDVSCSAHGSAWSSSISVSPCCEVDSLSHGGLTVLSLEFGVIGDALLERPTDVNDGDLT